MESHEIATPVVRHDGWTPERKARFLDSLASKGNVRHACGKVGLSTEAAYRLRRRDPLFARGWAAALLKAREVTEQVIADRAIDGVEEKVWYRGELLDIRRKFDNRLLLAHMARLDRLADEHGAGADAARFDELLACIAGEIVPEDLENEEDILPIRREAAAEIAAERAERNRRQGEPGHGEDDDADFDPEVFEKFEDECRAAAERGRAEGEAHWDAWFDNACLFVDWASGWLEDPLAPGLPGNPLPPVRAQAIEAAAKTPGISFPGTPSTPSTSAFDRSLERAARQQPAAPNRTARRALRAKQRRGKGREAVGSRQ